jgi:hypothetical protein
MMNSNFSPFLNCTVCHVGSENSNLANTSFSPSPWYLELWVFLQAALKV